MEHSQEQERVKPSLLNIFYIALVLLHSIGALLFLLAFVRSGQSFSELARAELSVLSIAVLTILMLRFRLISWLSVSLVGYILGLSSAAQMLFTPNVEGGYRVAILTLAVFTVHGVVVGGFAELVGWLQRVTHGIFGRFKF